MHDSKTTMHRLTEMGLAFGSCKFDTALAAYDLNPSQSDYPVSKLATNFLGISVDDGDAAACAEAIWNLCKPLSEELEKNDMTSLYRDIELPLCEVLYRMENRGILIDRKQLIHTSTGQCRQEDYRRIGHITQTLTDTNLLIPHSIGFLIGDRIPLIHNDNCSLAGFMDKTCDLGILLGDTLGGINHNEADIAALDGHGGTENTVLLNVLIHLGLFAHAGGINKNILTVLVFNKRIRCISRCARNVGNNHSVFAENGIDKR